MGGVATRVVVDRFGTHGGLALDDDGGTAFELDEHRSEVDTGVDLGNFEVAREVMDIGPIKQAMKKSCREYRKSTVLGKKIPLVILRIIWNEAFLKGATFMAQQTSEMLRNK